DFGLINFQGRLYDPNVKRFLSTDPHVTAPGFGQSWNPYTYVLNSPLNLIDPSGMDCVGAQCDDPNPIPQNVPGEIVFPTDHITAIPFKTVDSIPEPLSPAGSRGALDETVFLPASGRPGYADPNNPGAPGCNGGSPYQVDPNTAQYQVQHDNAETA